MLWSVPCQHGLVASRSWTFFDIDRAHLNINFERLNVIQASYAVLVTFPILHIVGQLLYIQYGSYGA